MHVYAKGKLCDGTYVLQCSCKLYHVCIVLRFNKKYAKLLM